MIPIAQRPIHPFLYLYSDTVHISRCAASARRGEARRPRNSLLTLIPKFTHHITTSSSLTPQLSLSPGSPVLSSLNRSSLPGKPKGARISTTAKPYTKLDNVPFFRKAFLTIRLSRPGFEGPFWAARVGLPDQSHSEGKGDVEQFRLKRIGY
jgi:hypothetical protein